jgi:hypothetical protein
MTHQEATAAEQLAIWRRSLLAHDELLRDDLDELDAHVRAAVEARTAEGTPEAEAVASAIRDVGPPAEIAAEYAKFDPNRVWRRRLRRMLAGALIGPVAVLVAVHGARVPLYAAGWDPGPRVGIYFAFAIACLALLLAAAVVLPRPGLSDERAALARAWDLLAARPWAIATATVAMLVGVLQWSGRMVQIAHHTAGRTLDRDAATGPLESAGYIALPPILIAVSLWMAHRERTQARAELAHGDDPLWSRRVRWMLVGQVVALIAPCLHHAARVTATLTWHSGASLDRISLAHGSPYIVTAIVVSATVAAASGRRRIPLTRRVDSALTWLAAGPLRSGLAAAAAYIVCVRIQHALYLLGIDAFSGMRYAGAPDIEREWTYATANGAPVLGLALICWLLWRDSDARSTALRRRHGRMAPTSRA